MTTYADLELIEQLQATLDTVSKMRKHLSTRQMGCACRGNVLCSLHGTVYNRLTVISDEMARAIGDLKRE